MRAIDPGQLYGRRIDGSPILCDDYHAFYLEYTNPCTELPAGSLSSHVAWQNYITGVKTSFREPLILINAGDATLVDSVLTPFLEGMSTEGCQRLTNQHVFPIGGSTIARVDLCDPFSSFSQGRRSVRPLCPTDA